MTRTLIYESKHAMTYKENDKVIKKFHALDRVDRPVYHASGEVTLVSRREAAQSEIYILRTLGRANHVVKLLDVVEISDHTIELVFAYAGQPIMRWIGNRYEPISDLPVAEVMRQTLAAVAELHDVGVVHKDLQPNNILAEITNDRLHIAICDFGSAVLVDKNSPIIYDAQGTLQFTPPEILLDGEGDGFKRDLYSVGILFFAILTLKLPFLTEEEILTQEISRPGTISDSAWALLQGLTDKNAESRWTLEQARSSEYLGI